jgi:hypothetical protein
MALAKIELKLGKKTISLTPAQFEELKHDMRSLDKDHHYYWHQPYYTGIRTPFYGSTCTTGSLTTSTAGRPPSFAGNVLSVV